MAKFTYRIPTRQYEYIEVKGDDFKEVMTGVKNVYDLVGFMCQHPFPAKPKQEELTF